MSNTTDTHENARIVLFSGGTALNPTARQLKQYTARTLHLLPPFDSGGSSAELRRHWPIAAVGDLRSRLLALADETRPCAAARAALLARRLPEVLAADTAADAVLSVWLDEASTLGDDDNWSWLCAQLASLIATLPESFERAGASFGNLMLAAAMVRGGETLSGASDQLAQALQARGQAHAVVDANLHLGARLADGRVLIGQHQLTGKEHAPVSSRIIDTWLNQGLDHKQAGHCTISENLASAIRGAALIVYGPGSFHSSLMAQLLPQGVCTAIAQSRARKVYVPNLGDDPELFDCPPAQALELLLARLRHDQPDAADVLDTLLIDPSQRPHFAAAAGCVSTPLATPDGRAHDPDALARALLNLLPGERTSRL